MTRPVVVRATALTRRFGAKTAVAQVALEISQGEIFGLVGPDGAGKTTTIRLLCGLLDPTEGEVLVAGLSVARDLNRVKDQIGYMAQKFGLYGDLSVDENMAFYADLFGISKAERSALLPDLLRMTRMEPFRKRAAGKLSGGMKQKLALMCTLLHRPRILFLDEPTTGVDPVSRRDFWSILYQLVKDGMTVVVATAYLDEAERCNRVGLMYEGRLVRCAAPQALRGELPYACYEVECEDNRRAAALLRDCAGVVSAEPAGAALHVFVSPQFTSAELLRSALSAGGTPPAVFRPIEPSLEDAFIALVRTRTAAAAGRDGAQS
jgi:ABC-2 type transport system ATP-binding protein